MGVWNRHLTGLGKDILRQHFKRNAIHAEIYNTDFPGIYWIDYPLQQNALVSIIIAMCNSVQSLQRCLNSLLEVTAYPYYEIIVVDNASTEPNTIYLETLNKNERIRVLHYSHEASLAELTNFAAQQAQGAYLLLLNDDTQLIQAEWLQRLLAYNQQKEVGIVGARLLDTEQKLLHAGLILGMGTVGIAGQINQGLPHNALGYMGRNQAAQNLAAVSEDCLMINKSLYQAIGGMDEDTCNEFFSEVDLCLKVRQAGYKIIWTPYVTLIQHGSGSLVRHRQKTIPDGQATREIATMYQRWLQQLSHDPAYNPHLGLKGKEWQPETLIEVPWDVHLPKKPLAVNFSVMEFGVQSGALRSFGQDYLQQEKPRIVAYPYDAWGIGEYRVRAPLRALQKAGLADYALMPNHDVVRMPTPTELARLQTDTLFLHNTLHDDNLTALAQYRQFNQCFKVFGQDDLIYALPKTNPYYHINYKDIKKRVHMAISLCDRFIVATEPLAEAYRNISDDIWIIPNYLESARWCDSEIVAGDKPDRFPKPVRFSQKTRVGWAGAKQHWGDLQLIFPVVKALAKEVEWVFFGMCPDELRPYVHEYHDMVPFEQYPAKLASLNLDLAIAPLENNAFNEAKSNLRLLEYGILGYPVVCSDIYPYQNAPVTRVPNTHQAWLNAIRAHVYDLEATKRAGHQLKQWVFDNWLLEDHIEEWARALNIDIQPKPSRFAKPRRFYQSAWEQEKPVVVDSPHCIFILGGYNSGTDLLASLLCQQVSITKLIDKQAFLVDALTIPTEIAIPYLWTEKENWVVQLPGDEKAREFEQQKKAWLESLKQPSGQLVVIENLPAGMAKPLWLQQHFPGAYFILMVRNGYAVALELQQKIRQDYEIQPLLLHRATRQWARSLEIFQQVAPKLDNLLEIRYEDLMANPEGVAEKICDFVNLPRLAPDELKKSLQRLDSLFATSPHNSVSLARMSAAQWAVIKQCAGDMLGYYGYLS